MVEFLMQFKRLDKNMGKNRGLLGVFAAALVAVVLFTGCPSATDGDALYTIRYEGNGHTGGSVPLDNNTYYRGMSAEVSGPRDLVNDGYAFAGWNIKDNGLGPSYQPGGPIEIETANVVLYAQWLPVPSYKFTYDGNGHTSGTAPLDSHEYYVRDTDVFLVPGGPGTLEKEGYVFAGWNTMADGSGEGYSVYYPEDRIKIEENKDISLYAIWSPLTFVFISQSAPAVRIAGNAGGHRDIRIPESINTLPVIDIDINAFRNNGLTSLVIEEGIIHLDGFGDNLLRALVIPKSAVSIGDRGFENNLLEGSLIIPGGVTSIGAHAFQGNQLSSVEIADSVTFIGEDAFSGNRISSLSLPGGIDFLSGFGDNRLTSVSIPEGVSAIGEHAFTGNRLESVHIPGGVTNIQYNAFGKNAIRSIGFADNGNLTYLSGFNDNQLTEIVIPPGITTIGPSAFARNRLSVAEIPPGVTVIEEEAFFGNALTGELVLPQGITEIGWNAFGGAFSNRGIGAAGEDPVGNRISSIALPDSIISLNGFSGNRLQSVAIPSGVIDIGMDAFMYNLLESLVIPNTVTGIGDYAFYGNQLTELVIPASVVLIGRHAFEDNKLTNITIFPGLTNIGAYAFSGNQLTELILPNSVTTIGPNAFSGNQLAELTIPDSVTSIGEYAFSYNQLTELTIPGSVTSIGVAAFNGNKITRISIGAEYSITSGATFGLYGGSFRDAYNAGGKQAGVYVCDINTETWSVVSRPGG
jgi:uncharacterized repeat protein (TIGR02543 family)